MTDKQINKFSDLTFTQIFGYDLVATFNNNSKIKELQEQLNRKEQECEELKEKCKKYGEINEQETKDYAELKAENEQLKNFHINLVGVKECEIRELAELEAENRSLKAYIKILENNNEVNKCENQ